MSMFKSGLTKTLQQLSLMVDHRNPSKGEIWLVCAIRSLQHVPVLWSLTPALTMSHQSKDQGCSPVTAAHWKPAL
jgi:hypothetical protein